MGARAECRECSSWLPLCELGASFDGISREVLRMSRLSAQGVVMPSFSESLRVRMMCVLMLERSSMLLGGVEAMPGRVSLASLRQLCLDESCVTEDAAGRRQILLSPGFRLVGADDGPEHFTLETMVDDPSFLPFISYARSSVATAKIQDRAVPSAVAGYALRAMHKRASDPLTQTLRRELRFVFPAQAVCLLFGKNVHARRGWACYENGRELWKAKWCASGVPRVLLERRLGLPLGEFLMRLSESGRFADRSHRAADALSAFRVAAHGRRAFETMPTREIEETLVAQSEEQLEQLAARLMSIDGDAPPRAAGHKLLLVADEHAQDTLWSAA
jgi:hypothetical protein